MVNTRMFVFRHPKYYTELRKLRNKSDQVISESTHDGESERAPGPGQNLTCDSNADGSEGSSLKLQAASHKHQASSDKLQATSFRTNLKLQAPSDKHPNQSNKRQASSRKLQAP